MKKLLWPIDMLCYAALYCLIAVFSCVLIATTRFKKPRHCAAGRVLQLAHYSAGDIERSPGAHIVFKSDLDGYLERVVTMLFSAAQPDFTDRSYGKIHRVIHVPQKPRHLLKNLGLEKTQFAISVIRLLVFTIQTVRQERIALIRAQDPLLFGFLALLTSAVTGVPYSIHVIQNYDISTRRIQRLAFPPFLFKSVERRTEEVVFRRALFVTSSYANYKFYALKHGARTETTFALRTPVNECHFKDLPLRRNLKAKYGLEKRKTIVYVGRLEKVKFVDDLIACLDAVRHAFPDVCLLMAGQGSLKGHLEDEARKSGLGGNIVFLGNVSQEDLIDLYGTADAILFTHAGITLVEAALSRKAIACYDHDWAGEFLGYDERGLLAPFRDSETLSRCVIRLLKDEELASSLGTAAREFAVKYFNAKAITALERNVLEGFFAPASEGKSA